MNTGRSDICFVGIINPESSGGSNKLKRLIFTAVAVFNFAILSDGRAEWEGDFDSQTLTWHAATNNKNGAAVVFSCHRSMFSPPIISITLGGFAGVDSDIDRATKEATFLIDGKLAAQIPTRRVETVGGSVALAWSMPKSPQKFDDYERLDSAIRKGTSLKIVIIDVAEDFFSSEEFDLTEAGQHMSAAITCGIPQDNR